MVREYVRKTGRAQYTAETLKRALEQVRSGELSAGAASRQYGIPRTTLFQRIKGKRGMKSESLGRAPAVPLDIEGRMASAIMTMEKWGFGLTRNDIIMAITQFVKDNQIQTQFVDSVPGYEYLRGFMRRNGLPQTKLQPVDVSRQRNVDPFLVHKYFELVADVTYGVSPERIYNVDEISFCLDPTGIKVVGKEEAAAHRVTASPGIENITVLMGGNAAGDKLPPLIIFEGKIIWDTWMAEFPGISYASTPNASMDAETLVDYFRNTFLPAIPMARPVVLIYDGRSSHTSMLLIEEAIRNNVMILKLPPHTSHLLQPMDLTVFRPLKMQYNATLCKWQRENYGRALPKSQLSSIISQAWADFDAGIIRNGFQKAGIYPFNNLVIPDEKYDIKALKRFRENGKRSPEPSNHNLNDTQMYEHQFRNNCSHLPQKVEPVEISRNQMASECDPGTSIQINIKTEVVHDDDEIYTAHSTDKDTPIQKVIKTEEVHIFSELPAEEDVSNHHEFIIKVEPNSENYEHVSHLGYEGSSTPRPTNKIQPCEDTKSAVGLTFKCYLCEKDTHMADKNSLEEHLFTCHPQQDKYHCKECEAYRHDIKSFNSHLLRHDAQLFPHKCAICPARYTSEDSKKRHETKVHQLTSGRKRIRHNPKRLNCSVCKKLVICEKIEQHMRAEHASARLECRICGMEFYHESKLNQHESSVHSDEHLQNDNQTYACLICGEEYRNVNELQQHRLVHDDIAQPSCTAAITFPKYSRRHRYKCTVCPARFVRLGSKKQHEANVGLVVPY